MSDPLLAYRAEFPILERCCYLVSNSLGAMPRTVPDRLAEYVDAWEARGVRAWADGWWEMPVAVGNEVAPLIGAYPGEVAMVPTVTLAQVAVLSALDYPASRNEVVMTALDFPSVRYAIGEMAPRFGARVEVVPSDDGITVDVDRLCAAITERTRLVAISHVLFRSASILDVQRICAHAHAVGALVSLDGYHAAGVIPVDVRAIGCDFYSAGVLKWLCGGPGGSFLWASPAMNAAYAPALTGWQAHERPFAFADEMTYATGAWRWLGGTPVVPALYANIEGPRLLRRAGIESVRSKSIRQTAQLVALADARGYAVAAPRDAAARGGPVAVDVPHPAPVARAGVGRDVVIDYRPGAGIRVAPHFYTSDAEVARVVGEIDDILRTDAWRAFAGVQSTVT